MLSGVYPRFSQENSLAPDTWDRKTLRKCTTLTIEHPTTHRQFFPRAATHFLANLSRKFGVGTRGFLLHLYNYFKFLFTVLYKGNFFMVQQQNEFTKEFESTRAIMLKQLFASGLVKIVIIPQYSLRLR